VLAQRRARDLAPGGSRQLGGLLRPQLRAEQHRFEAHAQPLQRDACAARLLLATLGQATLGVGAHAVRLRLGVTQ